MSLELEMADFGFMPCYIGLEVKQMKDVIFISQESYLKEILKKLNMFDCNLVNTLMRSGTKLTKFDNGEKMSSNLFKSLKESLRYLTCTRSNILLATGVATGFMEVVTTTYSVVVNMNSIKLSLELHITRIINKNLKVEMNSSGGSFLGHKKYRTQKKSRKIRIGF